MKGSPAVPGLPMEGTLNNYMVVDGRSRDSGQSIESRAITRDYFRTMGITLFGGRALTDADTGSSMPVAVINESLAKRFWPTDSPIGAQVTLDDTHLQIVGIVGNIKEKGLDSREFPTIYRPIAQIEDSMTVATNGWFPTSWLIRTAGRSSSTKHCEA